MSEKNQEQYAVLDCLLEQLQNYGVRNPAYMPGVKVKVLEKIVVTGDYIIQAEECQQAAIVPSEYLNFISNE